jgi:hypothetical protein
VILTRAISLRAVAQFLKSNNCVHAVRGRGYTFESCRVRDFFAIFQSDMRDPTKLLRLFDAERGRLAVKFERRDRCGHQPPVTDM